MPTISMPEIRELGRELSNWGRWGEDDQRGTLNLVTPEVTRDAAQIARRGVSFGLAVPADEHGPHDPRTSGRFNPIHTMTRYRGDDHRGHYAEFRSAEDMLVMGTHSSTHVDALSHLWYDDLLYNGFHHDEALTANGARRCAIDELAGGIVSRGVLLDVPRQRGLEHLEPGAEIGPEELAATFAATGLTPRTGDVVLLRTGTYPRQRRGFDVPAGASPGVTWECAAWLREHDIAAICADNLAVETLAGNGAGPRIPFHMLAIRDLGLLLGEMFDFEELAQDCAADAVAEVLFVATPLNIPGGVGSPVNPVAVK